MENETIKKLEELLAVVENSKNDLSNAYNSAWEKMTAIQRSVSLMISDIESEIEANLKNSFKEEQTKKMEVA